MKWLDPLAKTIIWKDNFEVRGYSREIHESTSEPVKWLKRDTPVAFLTSSFDLNPASPNCARVPVERLFFKPLKALPVRPQVFTGYR